MPPAHFEQALIPAYEYRPASHRLQLELLFLPLKLPGGQDTQEDALAGEKRPV